MYDSKIVKVLILAFCGCLLSVNSFGADPDNVALNQGDKAPYAGVLLPTARAQRLDVLNLSLSSCQKIGTLKDDENTVLVQRLNNAQNENKELASQLEPSIWGKLGAFALGSLVTTGIAFAVTRATR